MLIIVAQMQQLFYNQVSRQSVRIPPVSCPDVSGIAVRMFRYTHPAQYEVFKDCCLNNDLLYYRCEEIHTMLNDTAIIISKFEHYTLKVRWHIQRLYRIRNEITHSAFQEDKSLMIYIEHLYTYLAQLISEVVYYVEHKQSESVEEAFATILESYNTYIELLKEGKMQNTDVLPDGIIDITK